MASRCTQPRRSSRALAAFVAAVAFALYAGPRQAAFGSCGHQGAAARGQRAQAAAGGKGVNDGGNLGGDFWAHPWAEELANNAKGDDIAFEDVVAHFNAKREADGLFPLQEGSSPLVILEGIVLNSGLSGQPGMNKAQRIADGIQASSFLLSELTQ